MSRLSARPGLLDPEIEVRPIETQVDDLLGEIRDRTSRGERVLVTTLTKKMAEDLTEYLDDCGVKVKYIHHNVETMERTKLLRDLRMGLFDVLGRNKSSPRGNRPAGGNSCRNT